MAVFDNASGRIVVRIVYDGLAGAGKTTNLRQLCRFFTPVRRGELYTPEEVGGHTMYFDWLQLEGGIVAGHRLRCELVTVPGEAEFEERRERLLETADGVVFVCDSSDQDRAGIRRRLALVRSRVRGPIDVPLIIQANKQDAAGALPPQELADALGAGEIPIVPARASDGNGVREAAVMVIRAVADRVQQFIVAHGTDGLVGVATKPEELYQSMREGTTAVVAPIPDRPANPQRSTPPMPHSAAAAGMVWPSSTGRETLRALENEPLVHREDLAGRGGADDGSGKSDAFVYQAGAWCLKTSARRRYHDADEARMALVRLARKKLALEHLLLPRTAATVIADDEGAHWLWTIAPWVTTLRGEMTSAAATRDQPALTAALCAFVDGAVQSLELLAARGLALDVHPSNFARHDGRVIYLDDDVDESSTRLLTLGHALLRRVDEYRSFEQAIDAYIEYAAAQLLALFTTSANAQAHVQTHIDTRADVLDSIAGARPLTPAGQAARSILLERLEPRRKRA